MIENLLSIGNNIPICLLELKIFNIISIKAMQHVVLMHFSYLLVSEKLCVLLNFICVLVFYVCTVAQKNIIIIQIKPLHKISKILTNLLQAISDQDHKKFSLRIFHYILFCHLVCISHYTSHRIFQLLLVFIVHGDAYYVLDLACCFEAAKHCIGSEL